MASFTDYVLFNGGVWPSEPLRLTVEGAGRLNEEFIGERFKPGDEFVFSPECTTAHRGRIGGAVYFRYADGRGTILIKEGVDLFSDLPEGPLPHGSRERCA
jgi:hypothetical protein